MSVGRKVQRKLERRIKHHEAAVAEAKRKSGARFNPAAWRTPGSRNPKKT